MASMTTSPSEGKTTAVDHAHVQAPFHDGMQHDTKEAGLGEHAPPEVVGDGEGAGLAGNTHHTVEELEAGTRGGWFAYLRTRNFWIVLLLG